jgi:hypothetical protein
MAFFSELVPEGQYPFSADYSSFVPVSELFSRAKVKLGMRNDPCSYSSLMSSDIIHIIHLNAHPAPTPEAVPCDNPGDLP